jgi:hypothetical protein
MNINSRPQKAMGAAKEIEGGAHGAEVVGVDAQQAFGNGSTDNAFAITDATRTAIGIQLLRPRSGTVANRILQAFESGQSLTAGTAWRNHGCARLAAVVCDLKRMGWLIGAVTIEVSTADGRTAHVAKYMLTGKL